MLRDLLLFVICDFDRIKGLYPMYICIHVIHVFIFWIIYKTRAVYMQGYDMDYLCYIS